MSEPSGARLEAAEISIDELDNEVPPGARFKELPRGVLGYRIFKWLLLVVAVFIALLTLYGFLTYPKLAYSQTLAGPHGDAVAAFREARADWLTSVKDLGQMFLITPILPLIGAVLGYIFGRNEQDPASSGD